LVCNYNTLAKMGENAAKLAKPNAAGKIASEILNTLEEMKFE